MLVKTWGSEIQDRTCRTFLAVSLLLPGLVGLGCGSQLPMGQVSGRVTCDGKPVTEATIEFRPERGPGAFATLDSEGRYVLQTKSSNDGVVTGKNAVAIVPVVEFKLQNVRSAQKPAGGSTIVIPEQFRRTETSGLVVDVKPGSNVFDFELKQ
jgi:hypothetical protein